VSGNVDAQMTILWEMPKIYLPQILLALKCRMLYVYNMKTLLPYS